MDFPTTLVKDPEMQFLAFLAILAFALSYLRRSSYKLTADDAVWWTMILSMLAIAKLS